MSALAAARSKLRIPAMGTIENRFSRTVNSTYLSQGRACCDAIFGLFPAHNEIWSELWNSYSNKAYLFQSRLLWPAPTALNAAHFIIHTRASPSFHE
jgi:hypothetical protein